MTQTVAFLHSTPEHVDTFDALLSAAGMDVTTVHEVRETWLARARENGVDVELLGEVRALLSRLAEEADLVVCTCSTLGPIADSLGAENVLRVDRPMMERAVAVGGQVLLVLCLDSTKEASRNLLLSCFEEAGRQPEYRMLMIPDAWPAREAGDLDAFGATIARWVAAALSVEPSISCIVLGQASMEPVRPALIAAGVPVLTSPASAVARIAEIFDTTLRLD